MKIRKTEDSIDLEHLQATVETHGYQMIEGRVRTMLLEAQAALEGAEEAPHFFRVQGQVKALRRVLELPGIMARLIRAREERGAKEAKG